MGYMLGGIGGEEEKSWDVGGVPRGIAKLCALPTLLTAILGWVYGAPRTIAIIGRWSSERRRVAGDVWHPVLDGKAQGELEKNYKFERKLTWLNSGVAPASSSGPCPDMGMGMDPEGGGSPPSSTLSSFKLPSTGVACSLGLLNAADGFVMVFSDFKPPLN